MKKWLELEIYALHIEMNVIYMFNKVNIYKI